MKQYVVVALLLAALVGFVGVQCGQSNGGDLSIDIIDGVKTGGIWQDDGGGDGE